MTKPQNLVEPLKPPNRAARVPGAVLSIVVLCAVVYWATNATQTSERLSHLSPLQFFKIYADTTFADDIWLAISPYDPAEQLPLRTAQISSQISATPESIVQSTGPAIEFKNAVLSDVPFCFEVQAQGAVRLSPHCQRHQHVQSKMPVCGWQNLTNEEQWDQNIFQTDSVILARNIINLSNKFNCRHIVLDFENITSLSKNYFTEQISNLIKKIRSVENDFKPTLKENKQDPKMPLQISVAVYAKAHDPGEWEGPRGQDWRKICSIADEIVIMAYDFSIPGKGSPSETAPMAWVNQVLDLATQRCETKQIRLGLAAFGYNWQTGGVVSHREFQKYESDHSVRDDNFIFVEDAAQRREKIKAASLRGIHKFLVWSKGQLPANNAALSE